MKKIFTLFFSIAYFVTTNAQNKSETIINNLTQGSSFIAEGKVVEQQCFWNPAHNFIYTRNKVQIYSVFKGAEQQFIDLIYEGGTIGDDNITVHDGFSLPQNAVGIFFCITSPIYGNTYSISDGANGFVQFNYDKINAPASTKEFEFNNIEIDIRRKIEIATGSLRKQIAPLFKNSVTLLKNTSPILNHLFYELNNSLQQSASRSNTGITYTFEHEEITDSASIKFLEFDIYAASDLPTVPVELGHYLTYNIAAFDSNIVFFPNRFEISKTPNFNLYTNYQVTYSASGNHGFGASVYNLSTSFPFFLITSNPTPILHVKMKIAHCNQFADIAPIQGYGGAFTEDTGATLSYYTPVRLNDSIHILLCADSATQIYSWEPNPIKAGTYDTLIIHGYNLGDSIGAVYFKNADKDAGFVKTFPIDIAKWTPTEIKVIFSTAMDSTGGLTGSVPGTGIFYVEKQNGDTLSSNGVLTVDYALINYRVLPAYSALRLFLGNKNGLGGYTFHFNTTFSSRPLARRCFELALEQWRCQTGVNFRIGDDTTINVTAIDSVSIIRFAPQNQLSTPTTLAQTAVLSNGQGCTDAGTGAIVRYTKEIDFTFLEDSTVFCFDTTGVPCASSGKIDFYSVCLHEIGHAIGIDHALPNNKVMYWALSNNIVRRTFDINDTLAARDVIIQSEINRGGGGNPCPDPAISIQCASGPVNISEIASQISSILLYPNPNNSSFTVNISAKESCVASIEIINLIGESITPTSNYSLKSGDNSISSTQLFNLNSISSGIYLISITNNSITSHIKLIISK